MKVLAIEGGMSRELLSFLGRVIVHDGSREELEFLFPKWKNGQVRFVEVMLSEGYHLQDGRPTMWLRDHPDMDMVRWPLDRRDFNLVDGSSRNDGAVITAAIRRAGEYHDKIIVPTVRRG